MSEPKDVSLLVELFISVYSQSCTAVVHSMAQNSSCNFRFILQTIVTAQISLWIVSATCLCHSNRVIIGWCSHVSWL